MYFRYYLNDNKEITKKYENLKMDLWKKFEHNRDAYTYGKVEFIKYYTHIEKEKYGNRY